MQTLRHQLLGVHDVPVLLRLILENLLQLVKSARLLLANDVPDRLWDHILENPHLDRLGRLALVDLEHFQIGLPLQESHLNVVHGGDWRGVADPVCDHRFRTRRRPQQLLVKSW